MFYLGIPQSGSCHSTSIGRAAGDAFQARGLERVSLFGDWVETAGTHTEQVKQSVSVSGAFSRCFWVVPLSKMDASVLMSQHEKGSFHSSMSTWEHSQVFDSMAASKRKDPNINRYQVMSRSN